MKKLDSNKKAFIVLTACIIILSTMRFKMHQYTPDVTINKNYEIGSEEYFGTYRKGKIYIGSREFIDRIFDESTDDAYIVDSRDGSNPTMTIVNSYEFRDKSEMKDILAAIQKYEKMYPTDWDRTSDSMMNEWRVHNILYDLSFERGHTKEVDLDNMDEDMYDSIVLKKIFRN